MYNAFLTAEDAETAEKDIEPRMDTNKTGNACAEAHATVKQVVIVSGTPDSAGG